jgi:ABC-type lipoprotein export system ATPase subunit
MSAIEAGDVFYLYRAAHGEVPALRGLSLEIADGESVAVLGPSGAGKTTLLALAAVLTRPSSGQLRVLGHELESAASADLDRLRVQHIGIVRQHYYEVLPAELTVEEIVALPLQLAGRLGDAERRRVEHLLEAAGLLRLASRRPAQLSGGEQQRVAVCAALAKRPKLLLADEPTGELDAAASAHVVELLLALAAEDASTVLIVTHDPAVAARTERTIHLRDGRLAAEGTENPLLVLDRQGWLRLPERLRERAGFGERVRASAVWGEILLRAQDLRVPATVGEPIAPPTPAAKRSEAEAAFDRVGKRYTASSQSVFEGLSWTFAPERLHVIAGPSGSGKTTLLNLLAALDAPSDGAVWVAGERVDTLESNDAAAFRRRTIGYVSQHSTLVDYMSARENVQLALTLRGFAPPNARERAEQWLDWVGLGQLVDRRADQLSGGEQRRVALARAMAPNPRIVLADEPTAHLDRFSGRMITRLLLDAVRELGTTVIAGSHDPDVIEAAHERLQLTGGGAGSVRVGRDDAAQARSRRD